MQTSADGPATRRGNKKPRRFPGGVCCGRPSKTADFHKLHFDRSGLLNKLRNLVEVHVAIDFTGLGIHQLDLLHVLGNRHDAAGQGAHGGQFSRTEVHLSVDTQAVREVTGGGGDRGGTLADLCLVTHTQRTARHFHARAGLAENAVVAFLGQDQRIHLGRRGDPQTGRDVRLAFEDLDVVRVLRADQDWLADFGWVDFDDVGVVGVNICLRRSSTLSVVMFERIYSTIGSLSLSRQLWRSRFCIQSTSDLNE